MTNSWREMTLAAALAIGFSAHAHNCDPLVFLSLKVGRKTLAVTEAQLSALPQRVTPALARMLKKYRPLWLSLHFAHPAELTPRAAAAATRIHASCVARPSWS